MVKAEAKGIQQAIMSIINTFKLNKTFLQNSTFYVK